VENSKKSQEKYATLSEEIGWLDGLALVIGFSVFVCVMGVSYAVRGGQDAYWTVRARLCK